MKPNFVIFGTSGFGECIYGTAFMDYWSQFYNVIFVVRSNYVDFFKNYKFIHEVIGYDDATAADTLPDMLRPFINEDGKLYASSILRSGKGMYFCTFNTDKFSFLTPYPLSPDAHNPWYGNHTGVFIRHGMDISIVKSYDKSFRQPIPFKSDQQKKIILYMGSREILRRLPISVFNRLQRSLNQFEPYKLYCIYETMFDAMIDKLPGVEYISNTNTNEDSIRMSNLFASGVDLMVGPDSGLTNMALCFNIPQIWFETRDRVEMTIPAEQLHLVNVYRKAEPQCAKECRAREHLKRFGPDKLDHIIWLKEVKQHLHQLDCSRLTVSPCLSFGSKDEMAILNMVKQIIKPSVKSLIHPFDCPELGLKLYGGKHDGSYILSSKILGNTSAVYSYGIGNNVKFDIDLTRYFSFPIFQYDHTINDTPVKHPNFIFKKEALSSVNLVQHLQENNHNDRDDLLLKIDTEGAEYELFENIDLAILKKFNQIAIEIHRIKDHDEKCIKLLKALFASHKLVHIHANNYSSVIDDLPMTLELTLIRNDLLPKEATLSNIAAPIEGLDTPNNPSKPDYKLAWWVVAA